MPTLQVAEPTSPVNHKINFLWLELTNKCNLNCIHCYADSSPNPDTKDLLVYDDYVKIIRSAAKLGCNRIQFIGGEPTVFGRLKDLLEVAIISNYKFIEIYSNLTRIPNRMIQYYLINNIGIATSVYSFDSNTHDSITRRIGSHTRTMNNIRRLISAGISVRVGFIKMKQNINHANETIQFLKKEGVESVSVDRARSFGRASTLNNKSEELAELCGACWNGKLCVSSEGLVSSCIMSKKWNFGSIINKDLEYFVTSDELSEFRQRVFDNVWKLKKRPNESFQKCDPDQFPDTCNPDWCDPNSREPTECSPDDDCNPDACDPAVYDPTCMPGYAQGY